MRKLFLTFLASGAILAPSYAQTLFTYGNHPVSKEEFLRVYKKNSIGKAPDMSDTALKNYLDLYALFRMKVAEADKEKLDTLNAIETELDNYRKQLAKNYLTDEQVTNKLIKEAYDRMKEDVRVEHILISCPPGTDTVAAYRKVDSLYHIILANNAAFESLAKTYSDDRGSKENNGDVGYFTALQTVYPFENMAYNTPVGSISKPFRTQFGYHIMKVMDKRPDRGQVKVAQIMISAPKSKGEEGLNAARRRADSVEDMLRSGASFPEMVMKYSDDQYSLKDSGVLKPFGAGRMVVDFENAAFALKKPGDISAPIRTEYGYHIIKLIAKYPLAPYDTLYPQLKRKVENDSRAQMAKEIFMNKIKDKNGYKEYTANINEVIDRIMANTPDTGKNAKTFNARDYNKMTKPVFTLAGKNYLQIDYVNYMERLTRGKLNGPKNAVLRDGFTMYSNSVVNNFEEHKLVEENPDFKNLMEEYRDGIMLFELMDRNVWSKAAHDSVGLQNFYEHHKSKYMWEAGFEGAVYKFKNKAMLDSGMTMIKAAAADEDIVKQMNTPAHPDAVSVQKGHYEFSHFHDASENELVANKTKIITNADGSYTVVVAKEVYRMPSQKSLNDARGYVVAEYQDYLEKQWNEKMRKQYPMKVNETVFKSMVRKS